MTLVLVPGRRAAAGGRPLSLPAEGLPLCGRSLLQRSVELLADAGRRGLLVLLGPGEDWARALLGEGRRWGLELSYRALPEGRSAAEEAERLVAEGLVDEVHDPAAPEPGPGLRGGDWPGALDPCAYLETAEAFLGGAFPPLVRGGLEDPPGIRRTHRARIHPTARLLPPLYVGEGAEIGAGATAGPFASLEADSRLGAGSLLERGILLPGTRTGEGLEFRDCLVDGEAVFKACGDVVYVSGEAAVARRAPAPRLP